jgi:organic radical activating enzyme
VQESAPLFEVFSSVQGEATRVGERHLFVRLAGCDLECVFCDTPASRRIPDEARLFLPGGTETAPNPLARDKLDDWVTRLDEAAGPHHAISITGGEPLLFAGYLLPLLTAWRERGFAVLLETGGHRPDDLARVLDEVDIVMMDVKLASSAGFATPIETNRRFLELARTRECAVKLIVNARTTLGEIEPIARMLQGTDVPLILQPVTGSKFDPPKGDHVLELQRRVLATHRHTRVIPQTHRQLHVR